MTKSKKTNTNKVSTGNNNQAVVNNGGRTMKRVINAQEVLRTVPQNLKEVEDIIINNGMLPDWCHAISTGSLGDLTKDLAIDISYLRENGHNDLADKEEELKNKMLEFMATGSMYYNPEYGMLQTRDFANGHLEANIITTEQWCLNNMAEPETKPFGIIAKCVCIMVDDQRITAIKEDGSTFGIYFGNKNGGAGAFLTKINGVECRVAYDIKTNAFKNKAGKVQEAEGERCRQLVPKANSQGGTAERLCRILLDAVTGFMLESYSIAQCNVMDASASAKTCRERGIIPSYLPCNLEFTRPKDNNEHRDIMKNIFKEYGEIYAVSANDFILQDLSIQNEYEHIKRTYKRIK